MLEITEENISQLLLLNHIELKIVIYFMLIQKKKIIFLTTDTRRTLCDNLCITTQKLSSTVKSLIKQNILVRQQTKQFAFTININFADSYNDAVQMIYNKKYFKDESSF